MKYAGKQHWYRAESIVLTENAFAYNRGAHMGVSQSIADGYMGRCEMVWTTAGTNRVCGRCMALKDTVVGHTDESGVTLPPLHPRCRCAIMYREIGDKKPTRRLTSPTMGDNVITVQPQENAIVYDNGKHNGYRINFELMNTKAYHDRFENLTKHKAVNESLYKQAIKILGRRSGTEYEELVIIDARTGEFLLENADWVGLEPSASGVRNEQQNYLDNRGKPYEAIHNHPSNSIPSPQDIKTLFLRKFQVGSTVVCHNGAVYHLEKIKPFDEIEELIKSVQKKVKEELMGFPSHKVKKETSLRVIEFLCRKKILKFKEMS